MFETMYDGTLLFYKQYSKERVATVKVTFNTMRDIEMYAKSIDKMLDCLSCNSDDYVVHKFVSKTNNAQ